MKKLNHYWLIMDEEIVLRKEQNKLKERFWTFGLIWTIQNPISMIDEFGQFRFWTIFYCLTNSIV